MKNYKMIICYDGTRYYGWERQPGRDTIQGKLEAVLSRMCNDTVEVQGAGRTDAGVHARAMVASVHMETKLLPEQIRDYMNRYLPEDIAVKEVREAAPLFHARYKAVGKTYCYTCYAGVVKPVFDRKYVTVLDYEPDIAAMEEAAGYLTGKNDYKSFCGNPKMKKSTVRIVDQIQITARHGYIYFTFHGTGFLQNMIRILVGTLLEVGKGTYPPEHVKEILEAQDRSVAGPTAPAGGLCLIKVDY
jgi:tRNA pseudouridine38-40 synthase